MQEKIWSCTFSDDALVNPNGCPEDANIESEPEAIGFKVKRAVLFPQEVEKGLWPDDYSLSDHACLTVAFSPAKMQCSGFQNHG